MSPRTLTPIGWLVAAAAILAVLVLFALFNPWAGFLRGQVADARADEETAVDAGVGLQEGAAAQADVEKAATNVYLTVQNATEATHDLDLQARAAPDAASALDPARAARLRDHDQFLLGLRDGRGTDSGAGGAAQGGDPGGSAADLPAVRPADQPDAKRP